MADEESSTEEEAAPEVVAEVIAEESGSRRKKLFAIVGIVAVAAIAGGAGLFFLRAEPEEVVADAGPSEEELRELAKRYGVVDGVDYAEELDIEMPPMPEMDVASGDEGTEGESPAAPGHMGKIFNLQPFVVNISDRDRDRFLKLKADLELSDDEVADELQQRLPQVRDLIISLLGGKSFEDIRTIEGKNFLREEILLRINALLVTGKAKRVFFTEFVVQ